jgi:hypothetical protein
MDVLGHINVEEMLSGLIIATFLILLAASVVVISLMVLLPLIDLAFEKKVKPTIEEPRHHDSLTAHDASWQTGAPWLILRSNFLRQLMSDLPPRHLTLVHGSGQFPEPHHWTSLMKRTKTATQKNTTLIVPDKEARPDSASKPSNAA